MDCPLCARLMFWTYGEPDDPTPGWWTCEHCGAHVLPMTDDLTAQEAMRAAGARELFEEEE